MGDRDVYVQDANGTTLLARHVGWMPTPELAAEYKVSPLSDDFLVTNEAVEDEDGFAPDVADRMIPVYVLEAGDA